jgi:hypothetical protein
VGLAKNKRINLGEKEALDILVNKGEIENKH